MMNSKSDPPIESPSHSGMTLWDVMTVLAGSAELGGAWAAKVNLDLARGPTFIAMVIAVSIAVLCICIVRRVGSWAIQKIDRPPVEAEIGSSHWRFRVVYGLAGVWIVASEVIGYQSVVLVSRMFE